MKAYARLIPILFLALAVGCGVGNLSEGPGPGSDPDAGDDPGGADADPNAPDAAPVDDGRVKLGLAALYKFDEGNGQLVNDVSGVSPPLDLTIADPLAVTWQPGGGLVVNAPTILQANLAPTKINDACVASNEVSFEAWIRPANLEQDGPARILTYSIDTANRNFTLGQATSAVNARLRTTNTNNNGTPAVVTLPDALNTVEVQHVMYTFDAAQSAIYVNGQRLVQQTVGGNFGEWDPAYSFAIANEITLDRPWLGEIQLAAVYCRRLGTDEVLQNYEAGY